MRISVLVFFCLLTFCSYSQNVGIGTASPAYQLDVNGTLHSNNSISFLAGANGTYLGTDQGGNLELGANNSTANTTGYIPYIDFHYGTGAAQDFNVRLINSASGVLQLLGSFQVSTLTGTSSRPVFATASGTLYTAGNLGYSSSNKATFTYSASSGTGASGTPSSGATWTIPAGVTTAFVKLWGAGGGGNTSGGSMGGGGGYISGWLSWPSGTTSLTIIVGGGGGLGGTTGAAGTNGGGSSTYQGGGGGGRSCIQVGGTDYVAAGGGGGSINGCWCRGGGAGGGGQGLTGFYATANGQSSGGTQTGPGTTAPGSSSPASGHNGGSHTGSTSNSYGGGGGGGWYGGGSGGYGSANSNDGAGSGGSSGGNSTYFVYTWGEVGQQYSINTQPSAPNFPGGLGDVDYVYGVGFGGMPSAANGFPTNTAGNGYVVIYW